MKKITLEQLVEIAAQVEAGDPADWGKLAVGQEQAFRMIGTSILDMFDKEQYTDDDKLIMLATITKLTVENMLLNLKIMDKNS
jgi:hypothetical protein